MEGAEATSTVLGIEEGEKLIFKLDSQILNAIDRCDTDYLYSHIMNFRPLMKAPALERGGCFHDMLKQYYTVRKEEPLRITNDHALVVEECLLIGRVFLSNSGMGLADFEEDARVFKEYVLRWQYDGWEIIDIEKPFSRVIFDSDDPFTFAGKKYAGLTIIYEGIVDLIIKDPKSGMAVVDHKTESRRSFPFELSNQFQGYEWAFNMPVIVNKVGYQTSLDPKEKFRRLVHNTGAPALREWRLDAIASVLRAINVWESHLAGRHIHRNRTSCDKYSGCIWQRVCKVPEEVREFKLQAYFYKDKPWDPYTRDTDES